MDLIRSWDQRQRDDHLFLEVLQNSFLTFFTFPEEPRHFKFVTLNLEVKELALIINLELLQQRAIEIGKNR
jgi:hypothetical protein